MHSLNMSSGSPKFLPIALLYALARQLRAKRFEHGGFERCFRREQVGRGAALVCGLVPEQRVKPVVAMRAAGIAADQRRKA